MLRRSQFFGPTTETPVRDPLRAMPSDQEITRFAADTPVADLFSVALRRVTRLGGFAQHRALWLRLCAERVDPTVPMGDLLTLLASVSELGDEAAELRRRAGATLVGRMRGEVVEPLTPGMQEALRDLLDAAVQEHLGRCDPAADADNLLVALLLIAADTLSAESLGPVLHVERLTRDPRVREAAGDALRQRGIVPPKAP